MGFFNPLKQIAKQEISKEQPCGENLRGSAEFLQLKDEVRKLELAYTDGKVNWSLLIEQTQKFLQNQSKDILVAAYLVVAWTRVHRILGLIEALEFMRSLIKNFKTNLQPQNKENAAGLAINWMVKQLNKYLQNFDFRRENISLRKKLIKELIELDVILQKHFAQNMVLSLLHQVEKLWPEDAASLPEVSVADVEPESLDSAAEASSQPEVSQSLPSDNNAIQMKEIQKVDINEFLLQKSAQLRQENLFDIRAYLYSRSAIWSQVSLIIERVTHAQGFLPTPHKSILFEFKNLITNPITEVAYSRLEEIAIDHPYWLDVHYQVARKSRELANNDYIYNYLRAMMQQMLVSYPGLKHLKFTDETACFDNKVLEWLHTVGSDSACAAPANLSLQNIEDLLQQNDSQALHRQLKELPSDQQKLLAQLEICAHLQKSDDVSLLPFYLKQLETDFHHYHLEQWDPELAIRVLTTLVTANKCLRTRANNEQIQFALAKLMIMDHNKFSELHAIET
jgi:type VI secretion system protein VasJ